MNITRTRVQDVSATALFVRAARLLTAHGMKSLTLWCRLQKDVLSANKVWGEYLADNGYVRYEPDYPMDVYKFCCNFPHGTYVLGLDGHVVTVVDGRYYDTWDSGGKNVIYFWERG